MFIRQWLSGPVLSICAWIPGRFLLCWSPIPSMTFVPRQIRICFTKYSPIPTMFCTVCSLSCQAFHRHIHSDHEHMTGFFLITAHYCVTVISLFVYRLTKHNDSLSVRKLSVFFLVLYILVCSFFSLCGYVLSVVCNEWLLFVYIP